LLNGLEPGRRCEMPLSPMYPPQERRPRSQLQSAVIDASIFSSVAVLSIVFARSVKHASTWVLLALVGWIEVAMIKAAIPKAARIAIRVGYGAAVIGIWWLSASGE
jgi:hypothetical protein